MTSCFIVRAQVVDAAVKDDFDRWYQNEHLHDALKRLAAEFDRLWGDKVTRNRDIVEAIQTIGT